MKKWTLALAAASIGCAGLAAPALADTTKVKTASVSYAGLDLNTIEGQRMLNQRVEIAARRVCDYGSVRTNTRLRRDAQLCLTKARASARQQVAAIIEDQRRGG
ncbi:MAG: UrcA family protein [Pseudomonadota bacterium]